MPLDTIYLTRHGHRLTFTVDPKTGKYHSQFPTPTDNPADPTLTSHGLQQSHELAAHLSSPGFHPKPFRIYSSPYYRCLQTIKPTVEKLRELQVLPEPPRLGGKIPDDWEDGLLRVKVEDGVGEWFGPTSWFHHPTPEPPDVLSGHFPNLLYENINGATYKPVLEPSTRGETIAQLHHRIALALTAIIADLDLHISHEEQEVPESERTSKAVLICSHAAPLIAMGRVLTGNMPDDSGEEDFNVFTAGLSTFKRRGPTAPLNGTFGATGHVDESDERTSPPTPHRQSAYTPSTVRATQ